MTLLNVFVPGVAQPKGSTRAFVVKSKATGQHRAVVTSTTSGLKVWERQIRTAAQAATTSTPCAHGVAVGLWFSFLRPASVRVTTRPQMTIRPDLDKIARAVLDALTGVAYLDDAQVVSLLLSKQYVTDPLRAGVLIEVQTAALE